MRFHGVLVFRLALQNSVVVRTGSSGLDTANIARVSSDWLMKNRRMKF